MRESELSRYRLKAFASKGSRSRFLDGRNLTSAVAAAASLAVAVLGFAPGQQEAFATDYVISDQASCEDPTIGGTWLSVISECRIGTLTINSDDSLTVASGTRLAVTGTLDNDGTFNNNGVIGIDFGETFNNNVGGMFVNSGTINLKVESAMTNNVGGMFINSDTIINRAGIFENFGFFVNGGTIENHCDGTFVNNGTFVGKPVINEVCESVYNLTLSEGSRLGSVATARAVTNDAAVTQVVFTWIDPSSNTDQTTKVPVVSRSAQDAFTPDQVGTWTVMADFGNGTVVVKTLNNTISGAN
jgi:hypothetical protein